MGVKVQGSSLIVPDLPSYLSASGLQHAGTWDPATQTYNITPSSFANFRLALAKAKASVAPCYVTFDGDSISAGFTLSSRQVNSWPEQVRALMQTSGRWGNVYEGGPMAGFAADGTSGANDSRLTWDANVSLGGGAFNLCGNGGLGNTNAGAASGVATFGPVTCDVFDIYDRLAGLPAGAGWTWAVDGGGGTFVSQSGSGTGQGTRKTTISAGSYGSHTLTLTFPSSKYGVIGGIGVRKSADAGGVYFQRRGIGGANIGDGTTGSPPAWRHPVGMEMAYTTQKSHLAVISLGTNPEPSGYVPADWKTNLTAMVTAVRATGADVLLALAPPGGAGVNASQVTYLAAIAPLAYQVADALNVGIVDVFWRWGGVYTSTMDQYFQPGGSQGHPNQAGSNDFAFSVFNAFCKVA